MEPFVCLAYHRVTADPGAATDPYTVTPVQLRSQLAWLARLGFAGVSLGQALGIDKSSRFVNAGRRPIALTFDDGTADFATTAWALLQPFGYGVTLFVVTGQVGQPADWPPLAGTPLLDWAAVRQLASSGIEIGAHGARHRPMDRLPPDELAADLAQAHRALVDQVGPGPWGLAYPYGRSGPVVEQAAQAAGFAWAATARGGRNRRDDPAGRYRLRRTLIAGRDGPLRFALKVWTGYARLVEAKMDWRGVA